MAPPHYPYNSLAFWRFCMVIIVIITVSETYLFSAIPSFPFLLSWSLHLCGLCRRKKIVESIYYKHQNVIALSWRYLDLEEIIVENSDCLL